MLAYVIAVLVFSIAIELAPFAFEKLIKRRSVVTSSNYLNDVNHGLHPSDHADIANHRDDKLIQRHPNKGGCKQGNTPPIARAAISIGTFAKTLKMKGGAPSLTRSPFSISP